MEDPYRQRSYGTIPVGFGDRLGIAVVDFQLAFTEPTYPMGGGDHIERAVRNTARLLGVARRRGLPVACCYEAYSSCRGMPYWKIGAVSELIHGHPGTELDKRIYDPTYDIAVCKSGPSIFFMTPVVSFFVKERVDTVIIAGVTTSGCIRASVTDSFSFGFRTIVPEDCVGDHDEHAHRQNLLDMERRYCTVSDCDAVISELERRDVHAGSILEK